jgi:hypothetical protein
MDSLNPDSKHNIQTRGNRDIHFILQFFNDDNVSLDEMGRREVLQ